jgi:hypothetical protein
MGIAAVLPTLHYHSAPSVTGNIDGYAVLGTGFINLKTKNMKNIRIDYRFSYRGLFSTPHLSIGYSTRTPFADWNIDIDFVLFLWSFQIDIDNSRKYYPE